MGFSLRYAGRLQRAQLVLSDARSGRRPILRTRRCCYDQHSMASLRNVVGNGGERLVYGIDLSRGIARIDDGTGGGVAAPMTRRSSMPTRKPPHTCSRSGSTRKEQRRSTWGCAANATARTAAHTRRRSAESCTLATGVQLSSTPQPRSRARRPKCSTIRAYSNPNLAPERTRVGDATLDAPRLLGGTSLGWFRTSGLEPHRLDPPELTFRKTSGTRSIEGLTSRNGNGARARLSRRARDDRISIARKISITARDSLVAAPVFATRLAIGVRDAATPAASTASASSVATHGSQEARWTSSQPA